MSKKWNVVDYFDVWKMVENEECDYIWDVNGVSKTDVYIEIENEDEGVDILVKLVECEYLTPKAVKNVDIEYYSEDCIELVSKIDFQPLCRLEREVM